MTSTFSLLGTLLRAVPKGRWRFLAAILLAAAASGASVTLLGLSAWLISRAAEHPPVLYLSAAAVGVRACGIARGVLRYLERLVGHDLALRMQSILRQRTYDTLSGTTLLGRRHGDLLTRIVSDVAAVMDLVVRVIVPLASGLIVIIGTSAMVARFNLPSALVLLGSAILAGGVIPWWTQRTSLRADAAAVPTRGELADTVREISRTATDLLAYDADGAALEKLRVVDQTLHRYEARAAWVRGLATAAQILAAGLAVVAALALGADAVAAGELKPRLLAVVVLTPLALHEVLATFPQALQMWTRVRVALQRVRDVLMAEPVGSGDARTSHEGEPGLELAGIAVGWPGHDPVVSGLDVRVEPGEKVALVGPSGVGKTTVAATIIGLLEPMAGIIRRVGRVGYLAQDAHIFATSVSENVKIGNKDATEQQVREALARAGLDLAPERLIGEAGSTLSGGEARRLALARVLVAERDLLVLDEPTEHLDHRIAAALMKDIWAASSGVAVLVLTHDPEVIAACDRVIDLSQLPV